MPDDALFCPECGRRRKTKKINQNKIKRQPVSNQTFYRRVVALLLLLLAAFILTYAFSNRYIHTGGGYAFDKWTQKTIEPKL